MLNPPLKIDRRGLTPKPNFDGTIMTAYPNGDKPQGGGLAINSVTGTFAAGNTLTIDGTFTAKRNGQLFFTNFESETLGQNVTTISQHDSGGEAFYVASNDTPYFGSRFARCNAVQQSPVTAGVVFGTKLDEVYAEMWCRIDLIDFTDPSVAQIKLPRLSYTNNLSGDHQGLNSALNTIKQENGSNTANARPAYEGQTAWFGNMFNSPSPWHRYVYYSRLGTLDTANGERYVKVGENESFTFSGFPDGHLASPTGAVASTEWAGEQVVNRTADTPSDIGAYLIPYYTRGGQTTEIDADRIYINDSPERVVVGDASTWSACSHDKTFILKQDSRTASQIVADVDTTGPLEGLSAWLYVFNSDGTYNENGVAL